MGNERKTVDIGVIGCGVRLRGLVRRLLETAPEIRVAAIYDPSAQAREAALRDFGPGVKVCATSAELVSLRPVEWVLVGSPNLRHREQVEEAFAAGKHVFCEKPLATKLEDCLAMQKAWRQSGCRFFFGFCLRYSPFHRKIKDLLAGGGIGKLVSFEFNETLSFNHGGYIMGNWRRFRDLAGTHLLEKCCHDMDLANWFTQSLPVKAASFGGLDFFRPENRARMERIGQDGEGRPAYRVWADFEGTDPFLSEKTIMDNQVAILEYASGARATFHTNCNAGIPERRFILLGTEGAIRADALNGKVEHRRIGFHEPTAVHDCSTLEGHHGGDSVLIGELAACILHGRPPSVGVEEGIQAAIACFGVDKSLDQGAVVDLTPLWEKAGMDPRGGSAKPVPASAG